MKILVIGTGYAGLISCVSYALLGNETVCIDVDEKKIELINKKISPICEKGIDEALKKVIENGKLIATSAYASVSSADIIFISVGTPSREDGSVDLRYVEAVAEKIGEELKASGKFVSVVLRSTVTPGTSLNVSRIIEKVSGKKQGEDFGIGMLPEFLREGSALEDFKNPDRIVIGSEDEQTKKLLEELHSPFTCPKLHTDTKTAELIKYASNTFLLTKISFINELANFCEKIGVDVRDVAAAIGYDKRIAPYFLREGAGAGGSCFPKDIKALIAFEKSINFIPRILEAVLETNMKQPLRMIELAESVTNLAGKKVCILGLAFKPDTDDIREAVSLVLISELQKRACRISAYDPAAMENAGRIFPGITCAKNFEEALKGAEVCFLATEWEEFRKPATEYKRLMKTPVVIDGRRLLNPAEAVREGLSYKCIGWGKTR